MALLGALAFTSVVFAAGPAGGGKNAMDIAIIDRALASAQPGATTIMFGDCGMRISDLQIFRTNLVAEQSAAAGQGAAPLFATPNTPFKWPAGNVFYQFDPTQISSGTITAAKEQAFRDAIAEWAGAANLTFTEVTGTPPANYITVQQTTDETEGGFSTAVGMAGGQQFLDFGPTSWNRGTLCHEMGHALGLYHEQQRDDRDTYVTIDFNNIPASQQANFTKLPGGSTAVGPYDFYSVMEYSHNALATDPSQDTITVNPGYTQYATIIGNVSDRTLSKLDRAGMASIYGNPPTLPSAVVTNTKDSGPGSLRVAIYYAFDRSTDTPPTATTISFQIPKTDPNFNSSTGVFTIKPTYLLPSPGDGTTIDGTTETTFTGVTNPNGPEIVINGATSNQYETIGAGFQPALILRQANCTVKGFIINGFDVQGIKITSNANLGSVSTGNVVSGCYIGTDPIGTTSVPNAFSGIEVFGGAYNNTIGGTTAAARNIISGNTDQGIYMHDTGTTNNLIVGNYIGSNAQGTASLSNGFAGIQVGFGAQNNTIGGTTSAARNIISGNTDQGIDINDPGTTGNLVIGNYIGLNPAGTVAVANGTGIPAADKFYTGIDIFNGAQNNVIGGTTSGSGNVISGNIGGGVAISDSGTNGNLIEGNTIGLNATGTGVVANGSGDSTNNFYYSGVSIFNGAQNNVVGGTATGAANVISGNIGGGIAIQGTNTNGNLVQGNLIGTNPAGTAPMANGNANAAANFLFGGVGISGGAQSNVIGGLTSTAKNLISGNAAQGVFLGGVGTSSNLVEGNYIGTNLAGTSAIANNQGVGIYNTASSNTVGGNSASARNIISGNTGDGIAIGSVDKNQTIGPTSNIVAGNYVGVTSSGTAALANGGAGVDIFNIAQSNTIGGTSAGARNIISGNGSAGIAISQPGTNANIVQGNWVGVNASGAAVANTLQGVSIFSAAQSNVIGGTAPGAGNLISGNKDVGIGIFNYDTPNDSIKDSLSENSVFANTSLGIFLYNGANNNQAAPSLTSAVAGATGNTSGTNVAGTLTSTATTQYRIEFFWSPSGGNEGQIFLGSTNVTTNSSGSASFTASLTGVTSGNVITATATDPNGNTSQFSAPVTVTTGTGGLRAQTITFPGIANQPFNAGTITLSATASSGLAVSYSVTTGSATVSGNIVTITGAGAITIQATQAGNSNFSAATPVSQSFTATQAPQSITFPVIPSTTFGTGTVSLGATASSGLAVSYSVVSGPATVSGSSLTITGVGTITVQASQSGNANFTAASPASQAFTVRQASQTIAFPTIPNQTTGGPPVTLGANASSGLAIVYSVVSGPATVSGNSLTTTGSGTVTVQANQSGNANYFSAAAVSQSFTVSSGSKQSQTITFAPIPNQPFGTKQITLTATASSGLPVSYNIVSGPATVTGSTLSITGVGTITVQATQAGNASFNPAAPVNQSFAVIMLTDTPTMPPWALAALAMLLIIAAAPTMSFRPTCSFVDLELGHFQVAKRQRLLARQPSWSVCAGRRGAACASHHWL